MVIQASAEAMDFSKSLASLRHRPSHANVRSTTQRRSRPCGPSATTVTAYWTNPWMNRSTVWV